MSRINVCDRCTKELHSKAYRSGLRAKKPRYWMIQPTKSGAFDGWELSKAKIELCQDCTAEFMIFAHSSKPESPEL